MSSHSIKAVFFDVGNTLLLPFPSVVDICTEVLAAHGYSVDAGRLSQALALADETYEEKYRADDSFWMREADTANFWIELYELMLQGAGLQENTTELATDIYAEFGQAERWQPYPDVMPTLSKLSEEGLKIGLVSNWDTRLNSLSIETGISKYLDFVISSANVGSMKPQPQIFEMALERAGVKADQALHVGDHYYADILGARSAGITPILLDRKGSLPPADCVVINSLHELINYLWSN